MLRIKSDVDLKELEKFGFRYDEGTRCYYKRCLGTFNKIMICDYEDIDVCKGLIVLHNDSAFDTTLYLDTLYDIIQARICRKSLGGSYERRYKDIRRIFK